MIPEAFGQAVQEPARVCSENLNGSFLQNCALNSDFLRQSILPFILVSGGYFVLIFWSVVVLTSYVKYKNAMLTGVLGVSIFFTAHLALPVATYTPIYILTAFAVTCAVVILIWRIPRD